MNTAMPTDEPTPEEAVEASDWLVRHLLPVALEQADQHGIALRCHRLGRIHDGSSANAALPLLGEIANVLVQAGPAGGAWALAVVGCAQQTLLEAAVRLAGAPLIAPSAGIAGISRHAQQVRQLGSNDPEIQLVAEGTPPWRIRSLSHLVGLTDSSSSSSPARSA